MITAVTCQANHNMSDCDERELVFFVNGKKVGPKCVTVLMQRLRYASAGCVVGLRRLRILVAGH